MTSAALTSAVMHTVPQTLLVCGLLALACAGVCRVLRPRPAVRFGLWLVVLIKLLVPPVVRWPWDAAAWLPEGMASPWALGPARLSPLPAPAAEWNSAQPVAASPLDPASPVLFLLAAAWIVGSIVVLVRNGRRVLRFNRALRRSRAAPPALAETARIVAHRLGIAPPAVRVLDGMGTAIVWSWGRPRIVMPAHVVREGDAALWRRVLAHELAHIKRRDHWYVWLELAGAVVWWWNPIYHWVRYRLRVNAEMAADAWAARVAGGSRRAYAEALLWVARRGSPHDRALPALAASREDRHRFEDRLRRIVTSDQLPGVPRWTRTLLTVLTLAVLPGWTGGVGIAGEPPTVDPVAAAAGPAADAAGDEPVVAASAAAPDPGDGAPSAEPPAARLDGELSTGFPNPFHAATAIPFTLLESAFEDGSARVTLTVFDVQAQWIGHPVLYDAGEGGATSVDRLELTSPGAYLACWDLRGERSSDARPGVYIVELQVNGRSVGMVRMLRVSNAVGVPSRGCARGDSG